MRTFVRRLCVVTAAVMAIGLGACRGNGGTTGLNGHLLVIGGGLDDDNKPVYERLIHLASAASPDGVPRIVIATAASGDQDANEKGKRESIGAYAGNAVIECIRRETGTEETVAMIDRASAMFFTGGDQKRITTRYLKDDQDTPESLAMRRLLARGGVIAGTSAGDAMMSDPMFFTGRSVEALGIALPRRGGADDDADVKGKPVLGPQIGKGMGLVPWLVTDSHFFERNRVGRLVAALEQSPQKVGIGVGEDACVEIDLSTGVLSGVSVADSLLVDVSDLSRDGLTRRGASAKVIKQGTSVRVDSALRAPRAPRPVGDPVEIPVVEPGQNRQLASWRLFCRAGEVGTQRLNLEGWMITAWPAGDGWSSFDIEPTK